MLVSDFHYHLPEDLIAQRPPAVRGTSRMLTLDRRSGAFADHVFPDLPNSSNPATSSFSTTPASSPRASTPPAPASTPNLNPLSPPATSKSSSPSA